MPKKYLDPVKAVFLFVLTILPLGVHAVIIDFDSLASNEIVTNQFASQGVLISSSFGDVTVFTNSTFADTGSNSLNGGGFQEVIVTFVDPLDPFQSATTDFFQMTLGDVDITGNGMTAFDINGNQISQAISSCAADFACPGADLFETLSFSLAGMHKIVIAAGGQLLDGTVQGEATVDTLIFNEVSTSTVPIPAAVWLFGSGLLGLVGIARRKKAI